MSSMNVPVPGGIPPGVGLAPPSPVSMPYLPEDRQATEEENLVRQHDWAIGDAEADHHKSTSDLERDAERTRARVNDSVLELRERLGLDPDAEHAHGPFAPVRRHPFTMVAAAAGAATAAVVAVSIARSHRKSTKQAARDTARRTGNRVAVGAATSAAVGAAKSGAKSAAKATERRRKATRKRLNAAKDAFGSAAAKVQKKRKKTMRRLAHR